MIVFGGNYDQYIAAPFVLKVWETTDQALHIEIALATVQDTALGEKMEQSAQEAPCRRIVPDESCTYEIIEGGVIPFAFAMGI